METKVKRISKAAEAAAASPGVHTVTGATGLYLKKGENGAGSWFYRYSIGDKRREMVLGSIVDLMLADARKRANAFKVQRDNGEDPIGTRRRERAEKLAQARAEAKKVTFVQAAESYLDAHGSSWKHRYARAVWWNPIETTSSRSLATCFSTTLGSNMSSR